MNREINIGKNATIFSLIFALLVWAITFYIYRGENFSDRVIYAFVVSISGWITIMVFLLSFYWLYQGLKK
jgi:hypothetical protein